MLPAGTSQATQASTQTQLMTTSPLHTPAPGMAPRARFVSYHRGNHLPQGVSDKPRPHVQIFPHVCPPGFSLEWSETTPVSPPKAATPFGVRRRPQSRAGATPSPGRTSDLSRTCWAGQLRARMPRVWQQVLHRRPRLADIAPKDLAATIQIFGQ